MELIVFGLFLLSATVLGYKMGKGEPLDINIAKFKPIIRTEEQEQKLVDKLTNNRSKING